MLLLQCEILSLFVQVLHWFVPVPDDHLLKEEIVLVVDCVHVLAWLAEFVKDKAIFLHLEQLPRLRLRQIINFFAVHDDWVQVAAQMRSNEVLPLALLKYLCRLGFAIWLWGQITILHVQTCIRQFAKKSILHNTLSLLNLAGVIDLCHLLAFPICEGSVDCRNSAFKSIRAHQVLLRNRLLIVLKFLVRELVLLLLGNLFVPQKDGQNVLVADPTLLITTIVI